MDNEIALVKVTLFCVALETCGQKRVEIKAKSRLVFLLLFMFVCVWFKDMLAVSGCLVRLLFQLQLVV